MEIEKRTIYEALALIASEIPAIGKEKHNTSQNFKFRGVDDVYNAIQPLFAKYGVVTIPQVLSVKREERTSQKGGLLIWTLAEIKYTFASADGSSVELLIVGEAMDSGDKGLNKAYSIAHKYAMFQLFLIPTDDPDKESPTVKGKDAVPVKPKLSKETFEKFILRLQDSGRVEQAKDYFSKFTLTTEQESQLTRVIEEITNATVD
jgi:hypothetical protein